MGWHPRDLTFLTEWRSHLQDAYNLGTGKIKLEAGKLFIVGDSTTDRFSVNENEILCRGNATRTTQIGPNLNAAYPDTVFIGGNIDSSGGTDRSSLNIIGYDITFVSATVTDCSNLGNRNSFSGSGITIVGNDGVGSQPGAVGLGNGIFLSSECAAFGQRARAGRAQDTSSGSDSDADGILSVATGRTARALSFFSICTGALSTIAASASNSILSGALSAINAADSCLAGNNSIVNHVKCLIFASGVTTTKDNQGMFGGSINNILELIIGGGPSSSSPDENVLIKSTDASGVDTQGSNLQIGSGESTGNKTSGVDLMASVADVSGSSKNPLQVQVEVREVVKFNTSIKNKRIRVSSDYDVKIDDDIIEVDDTAGNVNINLLPSSITGKLVIIKVKVTGNKIDINPDGTDLIMGDTVKTILFKGTSYAIQGNEVGEWWGQ